MERRKALKALSTRKLVIGGQTSGIVAPHRHCEPLLFFFLSVDASRSMRTIHRNLVETRAEAIEPAVDADGGDRKIANHGPVDRVLSGIMIPERTQVIE
jgi:hypothetical protein